MKKIYMILSVFALCASCLVSIPSMIYAQGQLNGVISSPIQATPVPYTKIWNHPDDVSRTISGQWLGYWFVEDSISEDYQDTPGSYYDALFPDSDVTICSNGGSDCANPNVHLIGNILDPSSSDMQYYLNYSWSNTNPYTVDSLAIYFAYLRNSDPSIVDTLVVFLFNDSVKVTVPADTLGDSITVSVDLPRFSYSGPPGNFPDIFYGYDTVRFAIIQYDSTKINTPLVTPGVMQTFKIPLTDADAATPGSTINTKIINTNHYSVPAGGLVASVFGFIPGYDYLPGDVITDGDNAFFFYSDQPVGANLTNGQYPPYTPGDWNISEIADNNQRYQLGGQFNYLFWPSYSFYAPYQIQEHLVSYYVTGSFDVGINESISPEGVKLYQNQPNPFNQTTVIKYETSTAGAVTMEIRDLTGRLIMEFNQGNQVQGKHSVVVDLSGISQGMYLYTLKTEKESITRRMVVSE